MFSNDQGYHFLYLTIHQEDAEQSTFVPPIVGVLAPPASPPSGDKELHFAYMEPDLVQQDSNILKNKWRSISENQILKVRISGGQKGSLCKIFQIIHSLFCSIISLFKKKKNDIYANPNKWSFTKLQATLEPKGQNNYLFLKLC